jgi:Fic family protein
MAEVVKSLWRAEGLAGLPRRDRRPCEYEAYIPDALTGRAVVLNGDVAADVADAERSIAAFDTQAMTLADTEALSRILLRAECVASSRIEGLEVGARRLLRVEAAQQLGEKPADVTATEVLGNISAMSNAIRSIQQDGSITVDHLLAFHHTLLADTPLTAHAGVIRTQQNWIGGSAYNPCSASFVPPPHELVQGLLEDLCSFCNDDSLPAVAQAALAHAQFETIHPFVDGNGRTGRALIHLVLRRRGLAARVLAPISLVLATWSSDYVAGLQATRYRGPASSPAAQDGINRWIARFATAASRAVDDASSFEDTAQSLQEEWRARLGAVRANSATDLILRTLPGAPVITVSSAATLVGRSFKAVNEAINRFVDADILKQISVGKRNRAFEAAEIIDAFTSLERQLASPEGDTRTSKPVRRVPRRGPVPLSS